MKLGLIDIGVILFIGGCFVGLIKYIWDREFKDVMTPTKCGIAHKGLISDIKDALKDQTTYIELLIDNKILKELRNLNGKK